VTDQQEITVVVDEASALLSASDELHDDSQVELTFSTASGAEKMTTVWTMGDFSLTATTRPDALVDVTLAGPDGETLAVSTTHRSHFDNAVSALKDIYSKAYSISSGRV
jgi:hypothetical protein